MVLGVTCGTLVEEAKALLHEARPTVPRLLPLRLVLCGEDLADGRTLGSYNVHAGQAAWLIVCRAAAPLVFAKTINGGLTATFVTRPGHCDAPAVAELRRGGGVGGAPHLHGARRAPRPAA